MKKMIGLLVMMMSVSSFTIPVNAKDQVEIAPVLPEELKGNYTYYDAMSDEFNGKVSDMWLMDYMPWWSDTSKREQSGTRTRYRFIEDNTTGEADNQSLQIYVNGNNNMDTKNFQPYYLEMLSGPQSQDAKDRYLAKTSEKNNWNSKFAGFMAGSKNYLNTYRGQAAPIQYHSNYSDAGATTYGYFETRLKFMSMKQGQGIAPAFWFIGMQDESEDLGEVDVFEFLDNYTLDFTIHPKGDDRIKKVTKQIKFKEDMSKDYHTYGVLWDETGFSLYVDGEFIYKHTQVINYRMIPMFSINHHENGWIGSVDGKGHPEERWMDIDYYRVFKEVGVDPEPNKVVFPEMKEGNNIASAAYMSLFGLTGTEADATPLQWLNDGNMGNTVLSGLNNKKMEQSTLPEYLYMDWKTPVSFDTIILHAQDAKQQAPTLIDIEISKDGEIWTPVKQDIKLNWESDSTKAEYQTIKLDEEIKNNSFTRIIIKEANFKNGKFGLSEIEVGKNIKPTIEYLPLPDAPDMTIKNQVFTNWMFEDSLESSTGLMASSGGKPISYTPGMLENGKSLVFSNNNKANAQFITVPLKDNEAQIKSDEDFTLGMWIKPEVVSKDGDQLILFQQTGAPGGKPWLFIYDGKLGTYIDGTNRYGKQILNAKEWQYVSITFEKKENGKGTLCLYVNGELDLETEITYMPDSQCNPEAVIGIHKGKAKGWYNGEIDHLLLMNKALSPIDMKAVYDAKGNVEDIEMSIYDVTSIQQPAQIEFNKGEGSIDKLHLMDQINVIFAKTYAKEIQVEWNKEDIAAINFDKAGEYIVHGSLQLSNIPNVSNNNHLNVIQKIKVIGEVDASTLKATVAQINQMIEKDYTEDSWKAFLTKCQNVQTKETMVLIGQFPHYEISEVLPQTATQEVIDAMNEELLEAIQLLVEVQETLDPEPTPTPTPDPGPTPGPTPTPDPKPIPEPTPTPDPKPIPEPTPTPNTPTTPIDDDKSVPTGVSTGFAGIAGLFVLSGIGLVVLKRKYWNS